MQKPTLFVLAAVALAAAPAHAEMVVVPGAQATTEGNTSNGFPFLARGSLRYQQVFGASEFRGAGDALLVSSIAFRQDGMLNLAFNVAISDITIRLSTTGKAVDGLDTTFANNLGGDAATVYDGALTISSANGAGPNGTRAFDVVINFQTPFLYRPGDGNLLLDVVNRDARDRSGVGGSFDAQDSPVDAISRIFAADAGANTATTVDSKGLVARFSYQVVPEPSGLILLGLGAIAVGVMARRRG